MISELAYLKLDPWWLVMNLREDKDMKLHLHLHEMFHKVNVGIATVTTPHTLQQDSVLKPFITSLRGQGTTMH
ncbi:hypothetical protein ACFQH5_11655 [Halomonas salifodinae]|uniref:Uncharacterized protein n=1 Tax=Halomonas salifodinae TaxID=438745 RepID=A0ABW2EWV9_9GAMM